MADGNREVFVTMRNRIRSGKEVDNDTRDDILFTAVIDIYDHLEELAPVVTFYKVGMFFAGAIGLAILAFIGGLLTGQIQIVIQ